MERDRATGGLRDLVLLTATLTPSGALSPGPLTASAVAAGAALGAVGGLLVALGHMIVEVPYVALLASSYRRIRSAVERRSRYMVAVAAAFMLFFAALLAVDAYRALRGDTSILAAGRGGGALGIAGSLAAGVMLTCCNPFFLLWWVTVGLPLVEGSAALGWRGFAVMYVVHVSFDYAWLGGLAALVGAAAGAVRVYGAILAVVAALLVYYALRFSVKIVEKGPGEAG